MYRTILFYVGKKNIILNEQAFTLGQLTAEILNISPQKFQRMRVVCFHAEDEINRYSMEYGVMLKIWLSLLPEVFEKLKKKDKHLLGHLYGVYGYEKKSPDTLALELELTTAGVYKARDTAHKHLRKLYHESDLYIWRRAYQITKIAASKGRPNRSYLSVL